MSTYQEQSQEYKVAMAYLLEVHPQAIRDIQLEVNQLTEWEPAHNLTHRMADWEAYADLWYERMGRNGEGTGEMQTCPKFWNAVYAVFEYELACKFPPTSGKTGLAVIAGIVNNADSGLF